MIAIDTSVIIRYLSGEEGDDPGIFHDILRGGDFSLPPVVVSEIFSHPDLESAHKVWIEDLLQLDIHEGYWKRAGFMRAALLKKGLKAKLPDTLIAQSCIDHDIPLFTRDDDFKHFEKNCGLKLFKAR